MYRLQTLHNMYSFVSRLAVCAVLWMASIAVFGAPRADHVFIISIDGGKPAVIAQSDMPVLKQLAGARFQVLFHSAVRGSFHLSLTVLVHYRSLRSI